jgi:hypothetical protein
MWRYPRYGRTQAQAKPSNTHQQINPDIHTQSGNPLPTQPQEDNIMMTKEEFEALCRVVAWLQDEENQAIYQGSFRKPNNDTQVLDDYLCGQLSTGNMPNDL